MCRPVRSTLSRDRPCGPVILAGAVQVRAGQVWRRSAAPGFRDRDRREAFAAGRRPVRLCWSDLVFRGRETGQAKVDPSTRCARPSPMRTFHAEPDLLLQVASLPIPRATMTVVPGPTPSVGGWSPNASAALSNLTAARRAIVPPVRPRPRSFVGYDHIRSGSINPSRLPPRRPAMPTPAAAVRRTRDMAQRRPESRAPLAAAPAAPQRVP